MHLKIQFVQNVKTRVRLCNLLPYVPNHVYRKLIFAPETNSNRLIPHNKFVSNRYFCLVRIVASLYACSHKLVTLAIKWETGTLSSPSGGGNKGRVSCVSTVLKYLYSLVIWSITANFRSMVILKLIHLNIN